MPAVVEEKEGVVAPSSLHKLLYLPYPKAADELLRAALDLKEKVVKKTWVRYGRRAKDFTLYTGALGTAFLLFKAYQVTNNRNDLSLCSEIIRACDFASQGDPHVTFICGRAGVCALGAVVAKHAGDDMLLNHYLSSFSEVRISSSMRNEISMWIIGFYQR
ncbi:putative LanC-like protein GCL2 [Cocos nucifera]|nr:putative LanC-like protein GCL2 [Cocos nucifera]